MKLVTRTIITTNAEIMTANSETAVIENVSLTLAGSFADDKAIIKAASKLVPENVTVLKVLSYSEVETLYGMPESDFIANAKVLPPRTKAADEE